MANLQVGQVGRVQGHEAAKPLSESELRARIALHTDDSVEHLKSVRTGDGVLALPTVDDAQESSLRALYQNATPEGQIALADATHQLGSALSVQSASAGMEAGTVTAQTQAAIDNATEQFILASGEKSADAVVVGTMHMAVDGINQDIYGLATQLKGAVDQARSLREDIADFGNTIADWPDGATHQEFTWTTYDDSGNPTEHTAMLNKDQALAKKDELEKSLQTVGDMRQDWQLQLQDAMNRQAQALQLMSALLKTFHDTAKALINNMKA